MASNLTAQVRNIAGVTTAVARGDLSKKITVDVRGEILELKDTINTMVDQLNGFASEVTRVAREVGTEGKLGGQADVRGVGGTWKDLTDSVNQLAAYPQHLSPAPAAEIRFGEGLLGQCAEDRRRLLLRDVPEGYATISSALGQSAPRSVVLLPILFEDETRAVMELASIDEFSDIHVAFLDQLSESIGIVL